MPHLLILASFFLAAFFERTVFDLGPNIELVTLAMLLASAYFGKKESFWLTFLVIFLSDLVIGNTNIFIFTWSGFLIPALILPSLFKNHKQKGIKKIFQGAFYGAGANFFFFLWTNFGVWLLDSFGMYPKTLAGLISCYINGIPFWKNQLLSTIIFSLAGLSMAEVLLSLSKKYRLSRSREHKLI